MANRSKQERVTVHLSPAAAKRLRAKVAEAGSTIGSYGGQLVERGLVYGDLLELQGELGNVVQIVAEGLRAIKAGQASSLLGGGANDLRTIVTRYDQQMQTLFDLQREVLYALAEDGARIEQTVRAACPTAQRRDMDAQLAANDKLIRKVAKERQEAIDKRIHDITTAHQQQETK